MAADPNDGTQIGTGEVISDEAIDVNDQRADPNLPVTAYKVPRSKIAVGPYGQDQGDATHDRPLPVEQRSLRHVLEIERLRDRDESRLGLANYTQERVTLADSRGHHIAVRGVR